MDKGRDSENFYSSLLETLEDPQNSTEVDELLAWWDKKFFPHSRPDAVFVPESGSPLNQIRQMQAEKALMGDGGSTVST
ncbi:hypothetical protein DXG01_011812 [Tephrocybe rancida]|nr:hypothetical protein DXG01_011812 [Tephrocybe rancida]